MLFSVQESPDRIQHVYYRYMDPSDVLYDTPQAKNIRPHVERCFAALDDIIGLLDDWAGDDGGVVLCSDHGFTAWEVTVHLNALLAQWGYFSLKPGTRAMQSGVVRKLIPVAKRVLPRKFARGAKAKSFAAINWSKTRAFASPIPQQGIYVNLKGRERFGIVDASELDAIKDDIARRLKEAVAPDGEPFVDKVWRSEGAFHGDALDGAPDLLPVMRDHRYENSDEIFHTDAFSNVSHMPRGVHHPDGVVIVSGPGVDAGTRVDGSVQDVTPTLLYLAGLKVPGGLDGTVLTGAFDQAHLKAKPVESIAPPSSEKRDETSPYSDEEEAMIEESLRGLGYL